MTTRPFPPYQQRQAAHERQTASSVDKGHGRLERRSIETTTQLNDYVDWPSVGQVFKLVRERTLKGKTEVEVVHGITSLSREQADAARLLELVREHWSIENKLFGVRDVTLGEDACRVRTGSAPQILAALRNLVVHLLDQVQAVSRAAATRRFAIRPLEALSLLVT